MLKKVLKFIAPNKSYIEESKLMAILDEPENSIVKYALINTQEKTAPDAPNSVVCLELWFDYTISDIVLLNFGHSLVEQLHLEPVGNLY